MYDIVFIGGGAAGLFSAVLAKKRGLNVAVIERNARVGKKLLSTGNGRCNLDNLDADISAYNNSFPSTALRRFPVDCVIAEFNALGLVTRLEGRLIYPYSMLASSVLDCLRNNLEGVTVLNDTQVSDIIKANNKYEVITNSGSIQSMRVVLCSGSVAGSGYNSTDLFVKHGHSVIAPYPSLTQIPCDSTLIKGLTGVRHRVKATISCGNTSMTDIGEMLFKQNALSGIVSFNLSSLLARKKADYGIITIDFYPEYDLIALSQMIASGAFNYSAHKNIIALIQERAKSKTPEDIAYSAKNYKINVTISRDFTNAQAVSGGLCTDEFNPLTMESLKAKGLYAIGEVLDVDGKCGGYNLHWAWISSLSIIDAISGRKNK